MAITEVFGEFRFVSRQYSSFFIFLGAVVVFKISFMTHNFVFCTELERRSLLTHFAFQHRYKLS